MGTAARSDRGENDTTGARPVRRAVPQREVELERELRGEAERIEDTVRLDYTPEPTSRRIVIDVPVITILKIVAVLFALTLIREIWPFITFLAVSILLAAALSPYVALLERHGLSRTWSLTAVALTLVLAFGGLLALVVPSLVLQTRELVAHSDDYVRSLQNLLADHGAHVNLVKEWHALPKRLHGLNETALNVVFAIFDSAVALVTVLFLTLYLLSDQERIKAFFVGMFPRERRPDVLRVLHELRLQVGGYVRGQLITSGLAAFFAFAVLTVAQVPHSLALAVYVGIADLVPMFGGMLGMIPSVLIALTISPLRAIIVFIGFVLYQNLENHYIVPRVYSRTMRVSPLVALIGLLIGARLLGMLGMLIALPVTAALPIVLDFAGVHLRTAKLPRAAPDAATDIEP